MAVPSVPILVMDSITKLAANTAGSVAVAGSHGGVYAAYLAARGKLRGVILNDAGIGLEEAGIAGLGYLDALAIAAATVDYRTARIGDGADMMARGTISRVNAAAAALGCTVGERCPASAERMRRARLSGREPPPYEEGRFLLRHQRGEPKVWGLDSNSLAEPSDAGAVLVTGSHGGLLGGKPESAIGVAARAAVYNDAGIGIDRAGVSRLPVLAARGIAAATVAAATARIGEARSTWATGRLSDMNELARSLGAQIGMSVPELVDLVLRHAREQAGP
ncbi:MAG: hypothetical protein ACLQME_06100 [Alphaproteobacteria bacterium]